MPHKVIITQKLAEVYADPEVRAEMSAQQCAHVDAILQCGEPSPSQFRDLTHRLNRIYAKDD